MFFPRFGCWQEEFITSGKKGNYQYYGANSGDLTVDQPGASGWDDEYVKESDEIVRIGKTKD